MKKALESPENKKCIKAINFDLETKRVKEIFHSNSPYIYLKAYQLVSKFLKSNDFKHRQFSGYISSKKMSDAEILNIAYKLNDELPWFSKCVKKFDVTDVGEQHDLMYIFQKPEKSKLQSKSVETKENKTKGKAPISRKQIKNNAKKKKPDKKVSIAPTLYKKYFAGLSNEEIADTVAAALDMFFKSKEKGDNND